MIYSFQIGFREENFTFSDPNLISHKTQFLLQFKTDFAIKSLKYPK